MESTQTLRNSYLGARLLDPILVEVNELSASGERRIGFSTALVILVFVAGLIIGGMVTVYLTSQQINNVKTDVLNLQSQVSGLSGNQTITYQNITVYQNSTALVDLYENVKDSVTLIRGRTSSGGIQGSGFVYNASGLLVVVTNYHVVYQTTTLSVTFSNGNAYSATVNGTDPYADLAVLLVAAPASEFKPLEIVKSSTLKVGEPVVAIGNPYGLFDSLTTGVVSALGRTIDEKDIIGDFTIANVIQTSVPINSGNSGGPLLNHLGSVVGITTAIFTGSQGLAFAIPSDTILKEMNALTKTGSYNGHSYLGLRGGDMDYDTAQTYGTNITYGWRVADVVQNGPSYNGSERIQIGDVIIGINGTRIRNGDEMSSYLEENTISGEIALLDIARGNQTLLTSVVLGTRPPPPV